MSGFVTRLLEVDPATVQLSFQHTELVPQSEDLDVLLTITQRKQP